MDVERLEQYIYINMFMYVNFYVNFLCVYYYRMINLHHGHPWKLNGRQEPHISTEYRTTPWIQEKNTQ